MFKNNELQFNNTYLFLKYYNNNYRPIYHIEKYFYELINNLFKIGNRKPILNL